MSRTNGVTRFLVSGTDAQLKAFHLSVCWLLNAIERRGQTVFYTCMMDDREAALIAGREAGVTMQEMDSDRTDRESWNVVMQGGHPGWQPPSTAGQGEQGGPHADDNAKDESSA